MEIRFESFSEDLPGPAWQARFRRLWPAYRRWFLSEGIAPRPTYLESRRALGRHMPELLPTFERLCALAGGTDARARFLALWRPPPYICGCSQVVFQGDEPVLIRNYDYSPALADGLILMSRWNGRRVIAKLDCLWGCLDGLNEDGLAVSLTFGGRRVVGAGFGIPVVLRYLLETCTGAAEARAVLERVPVHMAYNVTVCDRTGAVLTAMLAPDRPAIVRPVAIATNHQEEVEWHRHATATATVERERFLAHRLADPTTTAERLADAFLAPPLYTRAWQRGFGTLYTAVYRPCRGEVTFRWPGRDWTLSLARFEPGGHVVGYGAASPAPA
jgi:predicted choloylglycine hydrolase